MPDELVVREPERITLPVPPAEDITAEALAVYYKRVDQAVKDTTAFIAETRECVRTAASDAEVRRIARHAARYALGLSRRPTPEGRSRCSLCGLAGAHEPDCLNRPSTPEGTS